MLFISVEQMSEMLEDEMVKDEPVPEEGRWFVWHLKEVRFI